MRFVIAGRDEDVTGQPTQQNSTGTRYRSSRHAVCDLDPAVCA
jgi:hypothetical protein